MGTDLFDLLTVFGGTVLAFLTAFATLWIVFELRALKIQRREQYTGDFLVAFMDKMPFPFADYNHQVLEEIVDPKKLASTSTELQDKRSTLVQYLNTLEMMSVQINQGILDEEACRLYARGSLIRAFKELRVYILNLREFSGNPKIYEQFEKVVRRWERIDDFS